MAEKKNVVVVGGGFGGTLVARELAQKLDASHFNNVLINDRPFYTHIPAFGRILVSDLDNLVNRAVFPYDKLFGKGIGTVKTGRVVSVVEGAPGKGGELVLDNQERIPYAALVLATGSRWPEFIRLPRTDDGLKQHVDSWRDAFSKAKHVVVVGAGAVGIGASSPRPCRV